MTFLYAVLLACTAYVFCLAADAKVVTCAKVACASSSLGCFHDNNLDRILSGVNATSGSMTPEFCAQFCFYQGYEYAGVEFQSQCFCGHSQPPADKSAPASSCGTPCAGNSSETCGGTGTIGVYHVSKCTTTPIAEPYCNSSLSIKQRVENLVSLLSVDEKISCISSNACSLPQRGLPFTDTWREALHGLRYPCARDVKGHPDPVCATSFPHAQLLAANFNRSLWASVGKAISSEARGFYNIYMSGNSSQANHALSFWAPDINLCRDPRWGRCVEVPGECPFLSGEYAMQYVRNMQEQDSKGFYKAVCMAKHFSAYDVEQGATNEGTGDRYDRGSFSAYLTTQDLIETYLTHFRTAAQGADLKGVMCSYNAVGLSGGKVNLPLTPSCANDWFNNRILRGSFNFSGAIVSDCGAVVGIQNSHHYTSNPGDTMKAALRGGTDLNCGGFYSANAQPALNSNTITMADLDQAISRVLEQLFSVGVAEATSPWSEYGVDDIDTQEHRTIAYEAARKGMVLLKNEQGVLPLKPKVSGQKIKVAALGPHYNSSTYLLGNYYGENLLVDTQTPHLGLQRRPEVDVVGAAAGCGLDGNDTSGFAEAEAIAKEADVAVVFFGLYTVQGLQNQSRHTPHSALEREGFDRTFLTLPPVQLDFVQAIAATGTPVVAVMINSGGLAAEWVYDNIPGVVEAFYPGEMGGDAIASVLLGDVSPSGRLPTTIYPANYTALRNITDMEMRPHVNGSIHIPGVTYRFFPDEQALFPFGYGATYTSFNFSTVGTSEISITTAALADAWDQYYTPAGITTITPFQVKISNVGDFTSDCVALGFVMSEQDDAPLRQLFDFERVADISPGSSEEVSLIVAPQAIVTTDVDGTQTLQAGKYRIMIGGDPDGWAEATFIVTGETKQVYSLPSPKNA